MRRCSQALILCFLPLLTACNLAVSNHAMFTPQDLLTTPLKNGLWAADDPDCKFNSAAARATWPNCAFWVIINDNKIVDVAGDKEEDRPAGFLIVGGVPPLVQIEMIEKGEHGYLFFALDPSASETSGRVTAAQVWPVMCGVTKSGSTSQVDPYPGFNKECQPATTAALRAAAIASRPKSDEAPLRWIRAE